MKCRECENFSRHNLYSFGWCKHNWKKHESDDDCNYVAPKPVEDCLFIGVDFSPNDTGVMTVMRREGDEVRIINFLKDEEAVKLYNKLIGKSYSICYKCSHHECAWRSDRCDKCEYFESK